jgi:hypothetical protein
MGGLSFLNGLFLAGAAAAAVPIIIHLVQRRRVQRVVFGSVRFLRKMSQRVVRRRRFTELLLILLRTLALALLAVAFARPFFWKPTRRAGASTVLGERAVLLLIDNSYSMRESDRFEQARKEALDYLDDLESNDPLAKMGLATFSTDFQVLRGIGSEPADLRKSVKDLKPTWRGTKLSEALESADMLLRGCKEQQRRIVLVTDCRQSAWEYRGDWQLGEDTSLEIVEAGGQEDVPNVFIGEVAVPRLVVTGGFPEAIVAKVVNLTDKPVNNMEVVLKLNGKVVEKRPVNVPARSDSPVRFSHAFDRPGDVVGSISVSYEDTTPDDNVGYFCVHVAPRVRMLLVSGETAPELVRNDGIFIATALVPGTADRPSPFEVRALPPEQLTPAKLKDTDAVILANVDELPPAVVAALKQFLDDGGGLGIFCGGRMNVDKFNRSLAAVAPCKLAGLGRAEGDDPVIINEVNFKHEIFAPFYGPRRGDFGVAQFRQYHRVRDAYAAQPLAWFSNGDPAMLEKQFGADQEEPSTAQFGRGKSLLFASATDLEWNDLCLQGVFAPFMHQFARRLCGEQSGGVRNVLVAEALTHRVPRGAGKVELRTPEGKKLSLATDPADGDELAASFTPEGPGIYQLTYKGGAARFAVNLDGDEPDLTRLDPKEVLSAVRAEPAGDEKATAAVSMVAKSTARERVENAQRIWFYLMAAVLLILAVEMILAARTGTA